MSAPDTGLLERPPDPHELIGDNWYEIDHDALAAVAVFSARQAKAASTAEQKTHTDTNAYELALPEGFEAQVNAGHRVGRMGGELAGWFTPAATEISGTAVAIMRAKLETIGAVEGADALIWAAEFRIEQLVPVAAGIGPSAPSAQIEIDALRRKIDAIKDAARTAIATIYEDVALPVLPEVPGLKPLIHTGPPATTSNGSSRGAITVQPASTQGESSDGTQADTRQSEAKQQEDIRQSGETSGGTATQTATQHDIRASSAVTGSSNVQQPSVVAPPSMRAALGTSAAGGVGGASGVPRVSSPVGNPLSGLGAGGSAGGASSVGGMTPSSGVSQTPAQQFVSGAAQGFSQSSPLAAATGASASAAAQPFKPTGSTMPAGPQPTTPPPSGSVSPGQVGQVQTPVSASPLGSAGGGPAAGGSLAPPAAAGVPNPAPVASPQPGVPAAPPPVSAPPLAPHPPPPPVLGLGRLSAALKAANHVAYGEGVGATPEFSAARALVTALHDPTLGGGLNEWACAVFPAAAGENMARFVLASREGMSWIPAGVFMPGGVTLAVLDPAVPYEVRKLWRGLRPPAHVLAHYGKVIGETPQIVVAKQWTGLAALFGPDTVIVAEDHPTIMDPNPLRNPAGRHRLAVAGGYAWDWVQVVPEDELLGRMSAVAGHVAAVHDPTYEVVAIQGAGGQEIPADTALRRNAVGQIGRDGGSAVWAAVEEQMLYARMQIMISPLTAPEPLFEGWNDKLTELERGLRGWEVLWLAQRPATREVLADMTYAALAALDDDGQKKITQIITGEED